MSDEVSPGDAGRQNALGALLGYGVGLLLAAALSVASFWVLRTHLLWGPGTGVALAVLAVAQMGVHLVFFLHITTGPDNTNNVLALAFGVLIVTILMAGSLWIMTNLNQRHAHMPEAYRHSLPYPERRSTYGRPQ